MISLVTYTYNDHDFAIRQIHAALKLNPFISEVIVVDDGSNPPLRLGKDYQNIIVVSHNVNRGSAEAKKTGINAASGEYILSVDCDIEFSRGWVCSALESLTEPGVGLIGAKIINKLYTDHLSKALYYESLKEFVGNRFAPGGLWLIKRECFHALGGLDGYCAPTHEDWYFSRKINDAGLRIVINEAFPATSLRRIKRKAYILRSCLYSDICWKAVIFNKEPSTALTLIQREIESALALSIQFHCSLLVYVKVAIFIRIIGSIYGSYQSEEFMQGLAIAVKTAFRRYPTVLKALQTDCDIPDTIEANNFPIPDVMNNFVKYFADLLGDEILDELESPVIPESNAQEATENYDFHYASCNAKT